MMQLTFTQSGCQTRNWIVSRWQAEIYSVDYVCPREQENVCRMSQLGSYTGWPQHKVADFSPNYIYRISLISYPIQYFFFLIESVINYLKFCNLHVLIKYYRLMTYFLIYLFCVFCQHVVLNLLIEAFILGPILKCIKCLGCLYLCN